MPARGKLQTISLRAARITAAAICVLAGTCAVAYAQPAADAFSPGANGSVYTIAVQPDGRILVAGAFTMLGGGGTGATPRSRIGRLNPDGSLDISFNPGANNVITDMVIQPDGKILVVGGFTMLGGGTGTTTRNYIGRLNPDGSLDASFNPGANLHVSDLALQADGKILVAGIFSMVGGGTGTTPRSGLARLNADGSVDDGFTRGDDPGCRVEDLAVQTDGRIIIVSTKTTIVPGGEPFPLWHGCINRLYSDGSVDPSLSVIITPALVTTVAIQADGQILVGLVGKLIRFNPDGSQDSSFNTAVGGSIFALAEQSDATILVGGSFGQLAGGATRNFLGRLSPDGSLDTKFDPGARSAVNAIAIQPDGKILVGGDFATLGGGGRGMSTRNRLGRLYANASPHAKRTPGDFDGDGKSDPTVFRPSSGTWYHTLSGAESVQGFQWGNESGTPVRATTMATA